METLYQQTNRLILEVQSQLNKLGFAKGDELTELERHIDAILGEISSNCDKLNILVNKEPAIKRQGAKIKADQLVYDLRHLQTAFHNYQQRRIQREEEERERDELLNKRFLPNNSGETSIMIDHALQHNTGLQNAHQGMDEMISSGSSILTSLREQRNVLKGAQKRILDIANTLGLSNTVMRLIDKRGTQDKWIAFGGMLVTCIIMFLVIHYLT
ncbi:Golgi SNAP receptor complex member 2 [Nematostella vectensis]|uniref:Golgi SNAP receptor complex member 2 n=1 Tax=Nematostella vectensis TaxID=45351 RepID=UPI0020773FC8|nr:Golgi SNAP receptor complex member 2 [Nematostella vectensis]